jgi:hypothetical protein
MKVDIIIGTEKNKKSLTDTLVSESAFSKWKAYKVIHYLLDVIKGEYTFGMEKICVWEKIVW